MSSRGLIWSTSKSLGFFLLITADQALSRFSLFKSAFNISLMLDVPHQTIGLWGHRGLWPAQARGHTGAALWSDVTQWGTHRSCSVPVLASLGGGSGEPHLQLLMPVVLGAIWAQQCPWSTEGNQSPLARLWPTCPQVSLQGCVQGLPSPPGEHWRKSSAILSLYPAISPAPIWKMDFTYFPGYKKAYSSRSKIFLPTSPVCLQQCRISVFLCPSIHSGSERKAIPWYLEEVAENVSPWECVDGRTNGTWNVALSQGSAFTWCNFCCISALSVA